MTGNRRDFIWQSLASVAGLTASGIIPSAEFARGLNSASCKEEIILKPGKKPAPAESIRFSVIGLNHDHIYGMVNALIEGGGRLASVYSKEADLLQAFLKRYPDAKVARSETEILGDNSIQLVASASIPVDRAPLGVRVMQSGKDYMTDKPGILTLEQLDEVKRVQKQTKRIYSIMYSERFGNPAAVQAGEFVRSGAIGKVVQTIGLGPHRMRPQTRPAWFFDPEKAGGILCDIGSHQSDQFLFYTGSREAEVNFAQIGNFNTSEYPRYQDFGDMSVRSPLATGCV